MMTLVFLLALAGAQDTESLPAKHRLAYESAFYDLGQAWFYLDRDPAKALSWVDMVFNLQGIDVKRDRKIIVERPAAKKERVIEFYPNYVRGRVRLALATPLLQKEPEAAQTLLQAGERDLRSSLDAGVSAADPYLRQVRTDLARLKAPPKPPEPTAKPTPVEEAFREPWFKLIEAHKFKSALDLIDAKGASLGAEKRKDYVRDTEDQCRKYVSSQLDSFAKAMEMSFRPIQPRPIPGEFARLFELPPAGEVVGSPAELDWARKERSALDALRASALRAKEEEYPGVLDRLLEGMLGAEALDRNGDNRWLRASGGVTLRYVEEVLLSLVNQSKEATPEQRHHFHEQAEAMRAKWSEAVTKIPREELVRNRINENPRRLLTLLEGFPIDVEELDRVSVDACFVSEAPDAALEHVISDLTRIRDAYGTRLPKDAARKLFTELVAATAAHEILAGKPVEDVAKGLAELGRSLTAAGGPLDTAQYGPKIEKIFAALKG